MLKQIDFYYFSPTGGTKKAGEVLAFGLAEKVKEISLADKAICDPSAEVAVVAVPVFGGRIPSIVTEKIAALCGDGKKAVTAVVYGVRAYEDALLELNDAMKSSGFEVIASAALIAQHSIVPEVGAGRPDLADTEEIQQFAKRILTAWEEGGTGTVSVPGNFPYKKTKKGSVTPISASSCFGCGCCEKVCPTGAIAVTQKGVLTDADKCIMCMACVAKCPAHARSLPPFILNGLTEKLIEFKDIRRENEFYI